MLRLHHIKMGLCEASTRLDHLVGHSRNPIKCTSIQDQWNCCLLQNSLYDVKKIGSNVS